MQTSFVTVMLQEHTYIQQREATYHTDNRALSSLTSSRTKFSHIMP